MRKPARSCLASVLPLLAALLAAPAGSIAASAADAVGEVASARGKATGILSGTARELAPGADVFLDETLQTSAQSRLSLQLGTDTKLQLGERTKLKIDKAIVEQGGEIVLERGAMLFDRVDSGKGGSLVVRTPFSVIATRGTAFFVGPSNGVTGVFVQRGVVAVRTKGGTVALQPGEGTHLTSARAAPTPPKKWGAARVAAALKSVN
jgi:ferric-dicitrate binding protein FerR (iron transport regulator)